MVKYQSKHPTKNKEVSEYILEAVKRYQVDKNCATLTLDSLVEIDILDKEQKMLGLARKYPTLKFGKLHTVILSNLKLSTTEAVYINYYKITFRKCEFNPFPPRGSPLTSKIVWR